MQNTFFQKIILVIVISALAAGFYVFFYENIVVGADQSLNGAYKKTPAAAHPTPRHF